MKILVRALIRWSWLLLLCLLIGYFGGKELSVLLPPSYQVTALVQLKTPGRASTIVQPIAAYATLVTSDPVLNPVLKAHPAIDRQTFVSKELVVAQDAQSQTISVQVTLPNAEEAVQIANSLAQALVAQQNAYIGSQYNKELQILQGRIGTEQTTINQLNQQLAKTPSTDTATIQQLNSQITQEQNLQSQDITSRQNLTTEQALYSSPFSVVQSAIKPSKPSSITGLIPIAPLSLMVAVVLGLVLMSLFEKRWGRINSSRGVQQKAALPLLGSMRWTRPKPESIPLPSLGDSTLPYVEECRVMMADVLFHSAEAGARILAITGLQEKAGASSIASELAVLLAQSKRRVLLVDANLHRPSLHKRLKIDNAVGLGNVLEEIRSMKASSAPDQKKPPVIEVKGSIALPLRSGVAASLLGRSTGMIHPGHDPVQTNGNQRFASLEVMSSSMANGELEPIGIDFDALKLNRYFVSTSVPNLYMLPAGKRVVNPGGLLSMPEVSLFLRWAANPIDYVVIDCPAVIHAETHVLGSLSDHMYLVIDATRDRLNQVVNAKEGLLSSGVKLSGLIVNKLGRWV